jgi:hypothetical protein
MTMLAGNLGVHVGAFHRPGLGERKVLALIPVIWALNLLDLLFTLLAYQMGDFDELNPLARSIGWHWQIVLKLACLAFFTTVCVAVRHRRITQLGCYAVTGVYAVLAVIWLSMFNFLLSPYFFQMLRANL